jgi:GDPmannose 4,6-dehydratase
VGNNAAAQRCDALITGINGQDGWYLARRLLELGSSVVGTSHRRDGLGSWEFAGHEVTVVELDLSNLAQIEHLIRKHRPRQIFNFAARASSAQLFDDPIATADVNGVAVARILEAIRLHSADTRFCQASSSEVFGHPETSPQDETTPKLPSNAYGAAKAFADHLVSAYRTTHGIFACSAILYPHESPRRPAHFLVRKVARAAVRIYAGLEETVTLGDLAATRDWGYAPDYVEAMRLMLKGPEPKDFVLATGESHSVADVCEAAFGHLGMDWRRHVLVDDQLKRVPEPAPRIGNATRARAELGWAPSIGFTQLITCLIDSDRAVLTDQATA